MENQSMGLSEGVLLQGGKYKILKVLGQGGFGITYLAEHTLLGEEFALKEFFMKDCCERNDDSSVTVGTGSQRALVEKFRSKFVREARMIFKMNHPNIVRVTDVFEENGTAYYVMENLPGGSLKDKVQREGPLPEPVALKYIQEIADALDYIHSRHTVHLDVKPSNVLLNQAGTAVLIDFGISKHYDTEGEQTSSTPVGTSRGFAPLEQFKAGEVSQFTPATDIYALGATLYNLVTGQVPPDASDINEDGLDRPDGISDAVWGAIDAAMQPRRRDRPQSIGEFLALLPGEESKLKTAEEEAKDETEAVTPEPVIKPVVSQQDEETIFGGSKAKEREEKPKPRPRKEPKKPKRRLPLILGIAGCVVTAVLVIKLMIWLFMPQYTYTPGEAVDLGLSVKWSSVNLGASKPEDYGAFFAWGEKEPKFRYTISTYKLCNGSYYKLTKYCPSDKTDSWAGFGSPDNRLKLLPEDDVARSKLGGSWRIPTREEWEELRKKCNWSRTGNGYTVTGPSGKSIFLPAAGSRNGPDLGNVGTCGYYWSSSLHEDTPGSAYYLYCYSGNINTSSCYRYRGLSVRPVLEY